MALSAPAADLALDGLDELEHDLHVIREQRGEHRRRAAIGNMLHVEPGELLHQFDRENCWVVPAPGLPKLNLPGLAFDSR